MNSLRTRGIQDIFIACTDNLTGLTAVIEAVFPKTEIQNCIIHQWRNSSKYVSYKGLKVLIADLKAVYAAIDEHTALDALDVFAGRWDWKYPKISQSWRENWPNLSTYFKYPQEVRKLIYHQCHRGIQPPAPESDQSKIRLSHRRQPFQDVLSCHDGYHEKMNGTAAGLEHDLCPIGGLLRGQDPRIAETCPHVKGKYTAASAAVYLPLTCVPFPAYSVGKAGGFRRHARPYTFALFFTAICGLHRFWDATQDSFYSPGMQTKFAQLFLTLPSKRLLAGGVLTLMEKYKQFLTA